MKVGDLVRVYALTHNSRKCIALGTMANEPRDQSFRVALIIAGDGSPTLGDYRKVLFAGGYFYPRGKNSTDFCSVHRMEVINEV